MLTYIFIVAGAVYGHGHESVNGKVRFHPFLDGTSNVHLDGRCCIS